LFFSFCKNLSDLNDINSQVVKADAYGHGAVAIARLLNKHRGINVFGVATLAEAIELRAGGLNKGVRVLVLGNTQLHIFISRIYYTRTLCFIAVSI
jgi:alanine racemase